MDHASGV